MNDEEAERIAREEAERIKDGQFKVAFIGSTAAMRMLGETIQEQEKENYQLRWLLWQFHNCKANQQWSGALTSAIEMKCPGDGNHNAIDFANDPLDKIEKELINSKCWDNRDSEYWKNKKEKENNETSVKNEKYIPTFQAWIRGPKGLSRRGFIKKAKYEGVRYRKESNQGYKWKLSDLITAGLINEKNKEREKEPKRIEDFFTCTWVAWINSPDNIRSTSSFIRRAKNAGISYRKREAPYCGYEWNWSELFKAGLVKKDAPLA